MVLLAACGGHVVTEPNPPQSPAPSPVASTPPSPTPLPTPSSCPPLKKWGVRVFNVMDGGFNIVPQIKAGGILVADSTPKFDEGGPEGQPCNEEHFLNCGGRRCEDPRGGVWRKIEGGSPWKIQEPGPEKGFQIKVGGPEIGYLVEGPHEFEVCPPGDLMDSEGFPVEALAGACERLKFFVNP